MFVPRQKPRVTLDRGGLFGLYYRTIIVLLWPAGITFVWKLLSVLGVAPYGLEPSISSMSSAPISKSW